jgi:hypothetical protein
MTDPKILPASEPLAGEHFQQMLNSGMAYLQFAIQIKPSSEII